MKRLTGRRDGRAYIVGCPDFALPKIAGLIIQQTVDRLAAIEEILGDEYDLDRLRKLKQADDEGRYGIPPVRLHQHIFRIFSGEIREETVCDATWEPFTPRPRWKVWVMGSGLPYYWHDVFGKTVFLTREEAEAALEGAVWLN